MRRNTMQHIATKSQDAPEVPPVPSSAQIVHRFNVTIVSTTLVMRLPSYRKQLGRRTRAGVRVRARPGVVKRDDLQRLHVEDDKLPVLEPNADEVSGGVEFQRHCGAPALRQIRVSLIEDALPTLSIDGW
jgi:hypothetical protein